MGLLIAVLYSESAERLSRAFPPVAVGERLLILLRGVILPGTGRLPAFLLRPESIAALRFTGIVSVAEPSSSGRFRILLILIVCPVRFGFLRPLPLRFFLIRIGIRPGVSLLRRPSRTPALLALPSPAIFY